MPKLAGTSTLTMNDSDLTGQIIGACFEVAKELGHGFLEGVYEAALMVALRDRGVRAERQVPLKVHFRSVVVGEFFADMVVEGKILVELKSVGCLVPEHQAQLINYLTATGFEIGLLVNFGKPRLEYKRCRRRPAHAHAPDAGQNQ